MEINVEIQGLKELTRKLSNIAPDVEKEIGKALISSAKKIESDAKRSIQQGAKTGRYYKRRGVIHRASAPGQSPASDTGRLVNSIHGKLISQLAAEIRASTKYARFLEFGTRFIKPRPYMRPAWEKNKSFVIKRMQLAINTALRKSTR